MTISIRQTTLSVESIGDTKKMIVESRWHNGLMGEGMKENICYIVGAGEPCKMDFEPQQGDYVIAADGGLKYLEEAGITADLVVGDFDSLQEKPTHANVLTFNQEKDETDSFLAATQGIEKGYKYFHLYGCTGGRTDHTFANIQLLAYLSKREKQGFLFDDKCRTTAITDTSITLPCYDSGYVSVFSYSEKAEGVCLEGLKYQLDNAVLTNDCPLGVSNEFIGEKSKITVREGTLIIVYPRKGI